MKWYRVYKSCVVCAYMHVPGTLYVLGMYSTTELILSGPKEGLFELLRNLDWSSFIELLN